MTITLIPMTAAEYADRREPQIAGYAQSLATARGLSPERALARARQDVEQLLPNGVDSPEALLFTAKAGGDTVGWLWIGLRSEGMATHAWIYNIEVDAAYRGKGYGRGILAAIEPILAARGVDRLALNVFGNNAVARHLYETAGYTVDALQMSKPVRPA